MQSQVLVMLNCNSSQYTVYVCVWMDYCWCVNFFTRQITVLSAPIVNVLVQLFAANANSTLCPSVSGLSTARGVNNPLCSLKDVCCETSARITDFHLLQLNIESRPLIIMIISLVKFWGSKVELMTTDYQESGMNPFRLRCKPLFEEVEGWSAVKLHPAWQEQVQLLFLWIQRQRTGMGRGPMATEKQTGKKWWTVKS